MKHNIKKHFGLFLAVCMLLTAVPLLAADAAQQAAEPQEELSQIAVFMQQLGLIGQDAQAGTKVTRADLAGAVYALSGSPTFTEAKKPQGVPETDAAYKAISYCMNTGILTYRPFMPTQTVTPDDAAKALLRVLDYDSAIQTYYNQARSKILKGAGASGKDVTVNSFATMLYNALLMRPFEIVGVNGDILNKEKSEDTLFYQAFHVVIVEDAVVNSISKDVNATTITLNDTTVIVPQTIDDGFLGRKSDFFVQYDEFYGTNTLIYVAYDDVKSYRANLDDIIDVAQNLSRVTVLNDEDEDVKIKITPDIKLILNGQVVYPVTTDSFQPTYQYAGAARLTMSGSITFFDNDQNGTYDTAVMDAWREYYVGRVIGAKKVLMEKYPSDFGKINTMDIFDEDHYQDVTIIRNNKEVEFTSIKPQDVLMIKETMGSAKPSVVIEAVNNRMSGTVEGIRSGALIIKGQEYPYSQYLKKTMEIYSGVSAAQAMQAKIGDTVNCKLNQNNEIVSINVVPASNYTYAYLVGAKKGGFSAGNQIYVFEKTGFKTLEISASAKLNGSSSYSGDLVSHLDINTPIKYRANKDGIITSIYNDMPVKKLAAAEFDGGAFYEGGSVYNLNSRTTILGVGIQNDGVVNKYYSVPMSAGLIEKRPGGSNLYSTSYQDMITVVDYDGTGETPLVIFDTYPDQRFNPADPSVDIGAKNTCINEYSPNNLTYQYTENLFVVNEVSDGLDDADNVVTAISGLYQGQQVTLNCVEEENMVYETAPMVTKNFNNPTAGVDIWKTADQNPYGFTPGVREGDILYIYKTPDGRVGNIIWLENVKNLPKKAIRGQSTRMYMQWGFAYGFISKVDGGKVTVETLSDGSMAETGLENSKGATKSITNATVYVYDAQTEKFKLGSTEDVYESYQKIQGANWAHSSQSGGSNNTWLFMGLSHWEPKDVVFVDFADQFPTQ